MNRQSVIYMSAAALFAMTGPVIAQPPDDKPASDPDAPTTTRSIEHGMRLLSNVRDNVLSFDDPAFYWFCRYVTTPEGAAALADTESNPNHNANGAADHETAATGGSSNSANVSDVPAEADPTPIKFLLERPNDYRGKPVTIEGTLVAKWSWSVDNRDVPNPLNQCEIAVAGTRALAAVVTTESVDAIPIRSRVRARGYFIKVRAFQTTGGEPGAGPLLVARSLTLIKSNGAIAGAGSESTAGKSAQMWILAGTLVAAVAWLMLRRMARKPQSAATTPSFRSTAMSENAAADDFDWMLKNPDSKDTPESH